MLGHNRGYENNYFENLKNVQEGQLVYYQTKNETKTYEVTEIRKISENDIDVVKNTQENKITLITCVENEPKSRLCVVAKEFKKDI